jgi:hypothetical protein
MNLGRGKTRLANIKDCLEPYVYGQAPTIESEKAAREIRALDTMEVHPYEQYCSDVHGAEDHYMGL